MKEAEKLIKICKSLKRLATKIVNDNFSYMECIKSRDKNTISYITKRFPTKTEDEIYQEMRGLAVQYFQDSRAILEEIDKFIISEDNAFNINMECIFLSSVWSGDQFGEPRTDGLLELEKELKNLANVSLTRYIINNLGEKYRSDSSVNESKNDNL